MTINFDTIKTPAYVIDESKVKENLEKLAYVKQVTDCKILLATKAYSCYKTYPLISRYLDGTTNSSLNEQDAKNTRLPNMAGTTRCFIM